MSRRSSVTTVLQNFTCRRIGLSDSGETSENDIPVTTRNKSTRSFSMGSFPNGYRQSKRRPTLFNLLDGQKERRYTTEEKQFLRKLHFCSTVLPSAEDGTDNKIFRYKHKPKIPGNIHLVDPSSTFSFYWHMVLAVSFSYSAIFLALRAAFTQAQHEALIVWLCLDYTCDITHIIDLLLAMHTAYMHDGILEVNAKKVRHRYLHSWSFLLDILSLIPADIPFLFTEHQPMLRFNRLCKFHKMMKFFEKAESSTTYPNILRLGCLIGFMFAAIHWNGCLYFMVSKAIGFGADEWVYPGIVGMTKLNETYSSFTRQYIQCFYWSTFTLTTIGELTKPRTTLEFTYTCIDFLIGILLFATVVGYVGNIVQNTQADRVQFHRRLDAIKNYMQHHKVHYSLRDRVIEWFDYVWSNKKHSGGDDVLNLLPNKLKAEIVIHVHLDSLKKVKLFQDCENGFLYDLVLRMRTQLYLPGDFIYWKGEVGHEMYIVHRGKVEVFKEGLGEAQELVSGSYFGESSLLEIGPRGNRRDTSVRSVGFSELFVISKSDLNDLLVEYPDVKGQLISSANNNIESLQSDPGLFSQRGSSTLPSGYKNLPPTSTKSRKLEERVETLEEQVFGNLRMKEMKQNERMAKMESAINLLLEEKDSSSSV